MIKYKSEGNIVKNFPPHQLDFDYFLDFSKSSSE